jgi:hypothetical protein
MEECFDRFDIARVLGFIASRVIPGLLQLDEFFAYALSRHR